MKTQNPGDMYNAYKAKVAKKQSKSHEKKESKSFEKKEEKGKLDAKKKKKVAKKTLSSEAKMQGAYNNAIKNNRLGVGFGGEPKTIKKVNITVKKK